MRGPLTPGPSPLEGEGRSALAGLALAGALWSFVFRSKRGNFWTRMALAAGTLGLYARRAGEEKIELRGRDVLSGSASAAGLYLIFQVGDRLARRVMPAGSNEIASIYRLRTVARRPLIAALLVTIIAPSEELFWRGLVQRVFMDRWGPVPGTLLATAAYGGVHVVSGNLTLVGAATTAGAYWGAEYALQPRLGPLLVSHVLWDVWIFLIAPTPGGRR